MRAILSGLYAACGALGALFMVAIAVIVLASIVSRLLGISIPGLTAYAGYCMAASSFLALAYTFQRGGHIRVSIVLQHLDATGRRVTELWCLAVGSCLAAYLAYFSFRMVQISIQIGDVSQAPDATPLWIPQLGMAFGATVLAIALVDRLIAVARGASIEGNGGQIE